MFIIGIVLLIILIVGWVYSYIGIEDDYDWRIMNAVCTFLIVVIVLTIGVEVGKGM